jgi:glycyl-tRNA synthetase (class II)
VKVAVLPLSRNADLSPKARDLAAELRRWNVDFDDAGRSAAATAARTRSAPRSA